MLCRLFTSLKILIDNHNNSYNRISDNHPVKIYKPQSCQDFYLPLDKYDMWIKILCMNEKLYLQPFIVHRRQKENVV